MAARANLFVTTSGDTGASRHSASGWRFSRASSEPLGSSVSAAGSTFLASPTHLHRHPHHAASPVTARKLVQARHPPTPAFSSSSPSVSGVVPAHAASVPSSTISTASSPVSTAGSPQSQRGTGGNACAGKSRSSCVLLAAASAVLGSATSIKCPSNHGASDRLPASRSHGATPTSWLMTPCELVRQRTGRTTPFRRITCCLSLLLVLVLLLQIGFVMLGTPSTCSAAGADRLLSATARRPPIAEYYVHGRGRGHASRGKTMVQALEQYGYHVCVFVDPDVAAMVQSVGSERVAVTSMPVGASLPSVWRSFTTLLSRFFMDADCSICQRREYSPDVIVTDGDFPGAWRAVRADIPAVAVGHGYVFSSTNRPAFASKEPWRAQRRLNKRTTDLADCTVGVSYYPLSPTNNHTIIAKPRLRDQFLRLERRVPARPRIVTYFRDEGVGAEVLDVLAATGYEILAFGTGSAVTTTRSGVRVLPFDETLFLNSLAEASAVVGTSGDNLIAESMTLGIPMLGLYRAGDDEQQLNAEMLEHAGFGLKSSFEDLNASLIQHFLDNLDLFTGSAPTTNWQAPDAVAATFECIKKVSHRAREWHRHLDGLDEDMVGPVAEARRRLLLEPPRAVTASPPPVVADAAAAALQAVSNQQAERAADAAEADVSFEFFGV